MKSVDSVYVSALDILLGEESDDDPCDNCEDKVRQYFAEKAGPRNTYHLQWR